MLGLRGFGVFKGGDSLIDFKVSTKSKFDAKNYEKQATFALAKTLTQVAFDVRDSIRADMQSKFDRPTSYTLNSLFVQPATKVKLVSRVGLRNRDQVKSAGPAAETIGHQFVGGPRKFKRSEGAFRRIGLLKNGQIIVPGAAAELDQYGNIKRGFMIKLLAYLQAFGEQGYKANTTDKRRASLAKRGKTESGYKTINGVVYFVSRGKGTFNGKRQHLPAGVWAKTGIHGVDVKPVLLFVDAPVYKRRIDFEKLGRDAYEKNFAVKFDRNFDQALATAR